MSANTMRRIGPSALAACICAAMLLLQGCNPPKRQADEAFAKHMREAIGLLNNGERVQAVRAINQAIELKPNDYDSYAVAADLLLGIEAYREAIPVIERGIRQAHVQSGPLAKDAGGARKSELCLRLGLAFWKLNRLSDAERAYREAIRLDPRGAEAYNDLGYMYAETNTRLDEALRLTRRALELKPNDGMITDSVGWVYYRLGAKQEALKYLQEAVSENPDDADIRFHLGMAQESCGDPQAALIEYTKAVRIKPLMREARARREVLVRVLRNK